MLIVPKYEIMKTTALFLSLAVMFTFSVSAQSEFVTTGGEATGSGGTASYSVGQKTVQTNSDGTVSVSEGVQQPYEISTVGIDHYSNITIKAFVFPNPALNQVQLKIEKFESLTGKIMGKLFDANGKLVSEIRTLNEETEISMENLPSGTYFFIVYQNKQSIKNFKIVKANMGN